MATAGTLGLAALELSSAQGAAVRDGLLSLIERERKLAELELLVNISVSGASFLGDNGRAAPRRSSRPPRPGASERRAAAAPPPSSGDAARTTSTDVAPALATPSGMLRPRAHRPELTPPELAVLKAGTDKCGLDLSRLGLTDESVAELTGMFTALSGEGVGEGLRLLDFSHNDLGKAGASAVIDAVKRFQRLEAVCVEENDLGGKVGQGAVIDIVSRAAVVGHIGITLCEAVPLPFPTEVVITPPGFVAAGAAAVGATKGKSASVPPKTKPKAAPAAKGKGKVAVAGAGSGLGAFPPGTTAQLARCVRDYSTICSVSLAGSSLPRDSLIRFLQGWTPPPPKHPAAAPAAKAADAPAPAAKGRATTAAKAAPAGKKGAAAPAAAKGPAGGAAYTPLLALNLSRLYIGALGAQDVALALCPVPGPDDPAGLLGQLTATTAAAPAAETAKPPAGKAAAAKKPGGSVGPPAPTIRTTLHGSLLFLRVLDLSSAGLTSHGALPVLEAVAHQTLCLSHLGLRDNFLDDAGAGALAFAIRLNAARITTFAGDASAMAAAATPMAVLQGLLCDLPEERQAAAAATVAILADPDAHPGCAALVEVLKDVPNFLSVTGPMPSVEGVLCLRRAALQARPEPAAGGKGLGDDVLMGWGAGNFYDTAAIASAARTAGSGAVLGDPRVLLAMPGRLGHACVSLTVAKVGAAGARLEAARPVGSAAASQEQVLWRLSSPTVGSHLHKGVSNSAVMSGHSGARQLAGLPSAPHDVTLAALPSHLGVRCFEATLRPGVGGHFGDAPAVIRGVPTWALKAPTVFLEWRATYTAPASIAPVVASLALVWHVVVVPGGGGGRPGTHVYTARFGAGSRDRVHARNRTLATLTSLAATECEQEMLMNPGSAAAHLTAAAAEQKGSAAGAGRGGASPFEWQEAAGLETPRPLGQHNDVHAGLTLPPAILANAVTASGAELVAWPVSWHCAVLPPSILAVGGGCRVHVYAEVVQTTARASVATGGSLPPGVGEPTLYAVHVLEAEAVALDLSGAAPRVGGAADVPLSFTF